MKLLKFSAAVCLLLGSLLGYCKTDWDKLPGCMQPGIGSISQINILCPYANVDCCIFTKTVTLLTGNPDLPTIQVFAGTVIQGDFASH